MLTLLRRLFRREPPHLRGRVPVDCGVGTIVEPRGQYGAKDGILLRDGPPPGLDRATGQHAQHRPDYLDVRTMRYPDGTTHVARMAAVHRNLLPPTVFEAEALRQRPSYDAAFTSARNKAERAADAGKLVAYVTADEYMAVRVTVSMRYDPSPPMGPTDLVLHTPHGMVRLEVAKPAPAENARRYSKEGGTW